jgi:hypothetical protein
MRQTYVNDRCGKQGAKVSAVLDKQQVVPETMTEHFSLMFEEQSGCEAPTCIHSVYKA